MMRLKFDVVLRSHALGTKAIPLADLLENASSLGEDVPSRGAAAVRSSDVLVAGTEVVDVVDIGESDHLRCTIEGHRMTIAKCAVVGDIMDAVHL
jgi:hypothetical protein